MFNVRWLLLIFFLSLTACSTPYQRESLLNNGYGEQQAPGNLVKVYFSGNQYTADKKAQAYVIRRAAEIGKQKQLSYFALYQTITDATINYKSSWPSIESDTGLPFAYAYIEYHAKQEPGDFAVNDVLASYNRGNP